MLKNIVLTIVFSSIVFNAPVFAQASKQPQQTISKEEVYWMMKSCEWLKAGYAPWEIEQYLTNRFMEIKFPASSSSALVDDISRQMNDILYQAAELKARVAVIRATKLLDSQGQCW